MNQMLVYLLMQKMIYCNAGEIWYLRLLLLNIPTFSSKDYKLIPKNKIVDGKKIYDTFQEAAISYGLVYDLNEATTCFRDAIHFENCVKLRSLFVMLTIQGFPTLQIYSDFELRKCLLESFYFERGGNVQDYSLGMGCESNVSIFANAENDLL